MKKYLYEFCNIFVRVEWCIHIMRPKYFKQYKLPNVVVAQSAGAAEYTDCISAER